MPATAEEIAATDEEPSWGIVWGLERTSWFQDFILTFGLSKSPEQALERVEHTLHHGRARPPTSASEFKKKVLGGRFFAVAAHMGLPVAGESRAAPEYHLRRYSKDQQYGLLWKKDGQSEMRSVRALATAPTAEEILRRAEIALEMDWFHRMHSGGVFYPIHLRDFVSVPGPDGGIATLVRRS